LAAPLHRHHNEDEYTYVVKGTLGTMVEDEVLTAKAGTWLVKPRGQWHTFWNAGDEPCHMIEIVSPAGFESYFREVADSAGDIDGVFAHPVGDHCLRRSVPQVTVDELPYGLDRLSSGAGIGRRPGVLPVTDDHVGACEGLVQQNELRTECQRAGDLHPSPLTAGKLAALGLPDVVNTEVPDQVIKRVLSLFLASGRLEAPVAIRLEALRDA
jgi:hypothetical protein